MRIYINPRIIGFSKENSIIYEGCGSVAHGDLFGPVKRPKKITLEACNEKMQKYRLECDGILSRVIQHEYDHLAAIEFTEKITDYKELTSREFYMKNIKKSLKQNRASAITIKRYFKV